MRDSFIDEAPLVTSAGASPVVRQSSLSDYIINVTEHNVRDFTRIHNDQDRLYGRPSSEIAAERAREFREKCITGIVFEPQRSGGMTDLERQKVREFSECYLSLQKDAKDVVAIVEKVGGEGVFVRVDDKLYSLTKNFCPTSWEMQVYLRPANIIEA